MVNVDNRAVWVIIHHRIGWLAVVAHHVLGLLEQEEGAEEADGTIAATQDEAATGGHRPVVVISLLHSQSFEVDDSSLHVAS